MALAEITASINRAHPMFRIMVLSWLHDAGRIGEADYQRAVTEIQPRIDANENYGEIVQPRLP